MTKVTIDRVHGGVGDSLKAGASLIDLTLDLSEVAAHDCPPVSHYRLVLREAAWLRRLDVAVGDTAEAGASLALFSTEADESLEGGPVRAARIANVGVIPQFVWEQP